MTRSQLIGRYFPWAVVVLAALVVLFVARPPREAPDAAHVHAFGQLPVVEGGRVKPLDTVARNTMMVIGTRQTYPNPDGKGPSQPAIRWMLDSMVGGELLKHEPPYAARVFRIDNDEVRNLLALEDRPGSYRYSLEDIGPKVDKLLEVANKAKKKDPKERALVDNKALELAENLQRTIQIVQLETPLVVPPTTPDSNEWRTLPNALLDWPAFLETLKAEVSRDDKATEPKAGMLLGRVLDEAVKAPGSSAAERAYTLAWAQMLNAYARGDVPTFNRLVEDYGQRLAAERPADVKKARFEAFFNHFEPFFLCWIFYIVAFMLTAVSWLVWNEPLRRAAFWLIFLTFVLQSWALVARILISGRPPVTNLYSSAVFIGWACVLLGLVLERLYGLSLGNLVASVCGGLTVFIAHGLAATGSGDTMGVMQAVLDTNFWLATHVVAVTLGYAATFVAGLLGIVLIVVGVTTDRLGVIVTSMERTLFRALGQAIYGVVCLATFLSFVGTVLGGIWADQSWGRFWGWDPKENGALIIVLMNALILHARWGGLVGPRGMAVLAVLGNIVTAWSWFGVNMLGVGLHSYGFMEGAAFWLGAFIVWQLAIAGLGMLPMRTWRSFAAIQADGRPGPQAPRERPGRKTPVVSAR